MILIKSNSRFSLQTLYWCFESSFKEIAFFLNRFLFSPHVLTSPIVTNQLSCVNSQSLINLKSQYSKSQVVLVIDHKWPSYIMEMGFSYLTFSSHYKRPSHKQFSSLSLFFPLQFLWFPINIVNKHQNEFGCHFYGRIAVTLRKRCDPDCWS